MFFFFNRIPNRIPAVMACTSSDSVDMIDVLPLPELSKLEIRGMKEDNLFKIKSYFWNLQNRYTTYVGVELFRLGFHCWTTGPSTRSKDRIIQKCRCILTQMGGGSKVMTRVWVFTNWNLQIHRFTDVFLSLPLVLFMSRLLRGDKNVLRRYYQWPVVFKTQ